MEIDQHRPGMEMAGSWPAVEGGCVSLQQMLRGHMHGAFFPAPGAVSSLFPEDHRAHLLERVPVFRVKGFGQPQPLAQAFPRASVAE